MLISFISFFSHYPYWGNTKNHFSLFRATLTFTYETIVIYIQKVLFFWYVHLYICLCMYVTTIKRSHKCHWGFCEDLSGIFLESLLWPRVSPQLVTLWCYQKGHLHSRWSGQMKVASAERYYIMAEEKCCKSWLHSRNHLCKDRKLRHLPEQCPTMCGPLRIL